MINKDSIISEIIRGNPERALVLDNYGIEFYQKGNFSLGEACLEKNINLDNLLKDLEIMGEGSSVLNDWDSWSLDFLITYIENNHHSNIRNMLGLDSAIVFAKYFEELQNPNQSIIELFDYIIIHLRKEEKMLFPYIKQLEIIQKNGLRFEYANFGTLSNPLRVIKKEHLEICNSLDEIINSAEKLFKIEVMKNKMESILESLRKDIHMHIYLLENIVFPRAVELEKNLINNNFLQN